MYNYDRNCTRSYSVFYKETKPKDDNNESYLF